MERTFITRLAEKEEPFAIIDGRLYQVSEREARATTLNLGETALGLVPAETVQNLERFYRNLHAQDIEQQMRSFLEARLQKEIKTQKELKRFLGDNRAVQFIVYEVFPHFMDKDDNLDELIQEANDGNGKKKKKEKKDTEPAADIDALLNGEKPAEITLADYQKAKAELIKEIEQEYNAEQKAEEARRLAEEQRTQAGQKRAVPQETDELEQMLTTHYQQKGLLQAEPAQKPLEKLKQGDGLVEILGNKDVLVMLGHVYQLAQTKDDADTFVAVKGKRFALAPFTNVESVEDAYQRFLAKSIKIDAVEQLEDQVREIEEAKAKFKGIEGLAKKNEFQAGDVGFMKHDEGYYVYLRVPKFAMKHPKRDDYYLFEECRVGVRINYSDGELHIGEPVVIDKYRHPFLQGNTAFQHICNLAGWRGNGYDKAMQVVKRLSDAKNVIMHGMTVRSFRSHGGTDIHDSHYWSEVLKDKLAGRDITRAKAEKEGYQITNFLWN
ncbi:MAG: hypothetical protein KJ574_03945 [Nanoarchaeota archaeon]|nr:hypothetical protein [Nanoarchaeota archaeon]